MASLTESSLLKNLQTSNFTNLHQHFSEHLKPFSDFLPFDFTSTKNSKKKKTITTTKTSKRTEISTDLKLIRPLAKQFLPIIQSALKLLPAQLIELYKSSEGKDEESAKELFDVYKLCIECLTCIFPCLECKWFSVHFQRIRLIKCYEDWGRFVDAEVEGFLILESLSKKKEIRLPEVNEDPELACLVVEIVVSLVKCSFKSQRKEDAVYQRLLPLVNQAEPWFRVLDSKVFERMHPELVNNLYKCTLFMLEDDESFNANLVHTFCLTTVSESQKSPRKDQFLKITHNICSAFSSAHINRSPVIRDILKCVLDFIACDCKVGMKDTVNECFNIVNYCVKRCRLASKDSCRDAGRSLENLACNSLKVLVPIDYILRIYAAGLCVSDSILEKSCIESESSLAESLITLSTHSGDDLLFLTDVLHSLASYFHVASKKRGSLKCSVDCRIEHGTVSFLSYLKALAFFCRPFAELVNKEGKLLLDDKQSAKLSSSISCILDAFQQFCDACLVHFSATSEREREKFIESQDTLLYVAIAALKISLRTDKNVERSVHHIDRIMSSSWWVQVKEMKFLITSLHNVGAEFYNAKQFKQASVAFDLCCKCAWNRVSFVTDKYIEDSAPIHDDCSEAVTQFVREACSKTVTLLDVLHELGSSDVWRIIVDSLINWSVVSSLYENSGGPTTLVKKWVKIMCEDYKDVAVDNAPTLYSLLRKSPTTFKERTIGIILEQELQSYEEMEAQNTNLCQRMQLDIIDILLCNVYVTNDYFLHKSMTLIKKGRMLRARGIDGLNSCIECLSEAISTLQTMKQIDVSGEYSGNYSPISHNLALAYCLRALCVQEAQSNSVVMLYKGSSIEEVLMKDIPCALELWSSINWSSDVHYDLENAIQLLYSIADLLSIKGYFHFHCNIFKLLILFMERKSVPPEKCFAMLWTDRRLTHALCTKPIDEGVISSFAQHFGVRSNTHTVDFWVSCINNMEPLVVAFRQKFSLYDSISPQVGHCHPGSPLGSNVTVDEVKEAASALISSAHTTNSTFLVGYLYYDLGERLVSSGQIIEAVSFAREALRLRTKLLQKNFICTFEKHTRNSSETGKVCSKNESDHARLEIFASVATEIWPHKRSPDIEQRKITQWNVLRCYLESILQVGAIQETLGNAAVAERLLVQGRNISAKEGLPIFRVAFTSALGEIYCKKGLWDLATTELNSAKQTLLDSSTCISCKQCQLTLEVAVDQRIGDLTRIRSKDNSFSAALRLYRSALDKLRQFEWEIPYSFSAEASHFGNKAYCSQKIDTEGSHHNLDCIKSKSVPKRVPKERKSKTERMTRSRIRPSCNKDLNNQDEVESECTKTYSGNDVFACPSTHSWSEQHLELNRPFTTDFGCAKMFVGNRKNCWKCLLVKVMESGNMQDFIHMKWEFHCRRLSLRLLNEIGKCFGEYDNVNEMHGIFWQSIAMLFDSKPFYDTYSSPHSHLLEFFGKESKGDIFAIERAETLYNLSWFSLKNIGSRKACCDLSQIQLQMVVSWLLEAYMLSREVPMLLQKVSRLLATVFLLSTFGEPFCLPLFPKKTLTGNHWAAYFHQASIGTYFNHQLCSNSNILNPSNSREFEGSHTAPSTGKLTELCNILRFAPRRFDDLEKFVIDFFRLLPSITVICISLLGSDYVSLLRDVLPKDVFGGYFASTAWMLFSRLNSDNEPIVMLLPVDVIPQNKDHAADCSTLFEGTNTNKSWLCPWGCTVVDEVAPEFKLILEENYLSSSFFPTVDTQDNRLLWWTRRRKLNDRLGKFVRDIEDSWFGSWKCLLMGDPLDSTRLNSVLSKMTSELNVNENLLRVILGGGGSVLEIEECISQMLIHKGCIKGGSCPDMKCDLLSISCAKYEPEAECNRRPIIMVLDSDVQMLPWENLPALRNAEVYRMPSVSSISALIDVNFHRQEQIGRTDGTFPSIDPLDAFYLLNPSGDLNCTQTEFEEWFRDQKLEGKAGIPASVEELVLALKNHDLFIYFGHGSGTQYIPVHEIQKLENCAATLLMGCSSGCLPFMGCYNPQGAVLSYLLAGSPSIIANLWEVTDKDIDRFGKTMLSSWLRERSTSTISYNPRNLEEEFESMNIENTGKNAPTRKISRTRRSRNDNGSSRSKDTCSHRPKIGSFMSEAREACTLPFLIGASPVCYGVPTGIYKKEREL